MGQLQIVLSAAALTMIGCVTEPARPPTQDNPPPTPPSEVTSVRLPEHAPGGMAGGGVFTLTGVATAGQATVEAAPYDDLEGSFTRVGTGMLDVTAGGQRYGGADFASVSTAYVDGEAYAMLAGFRITDVGGADFAEQFIIHLRAADVVPGAEIALDGEARFVVFMAGDPNLDAPSVAAVATTGTVRIREAGLSAGGVVSADVTAEFVDATWTEPEAPAVVEAGSYRLSIGALDVYCDGPLAGREGEFASLTAEALGITSGTVELVAEPAGLTATGAPVETFFAQAAVPLDAQDGLLVGYAPATGTTGPAATIHTDNWWLVDGTRATATQVETWFIAGFQADDGGYCQVGVAATLVR